MKANPEMIKMWASRTKCLYCKHRFSEPLILPVKKPKRDKLQPHFSAEWLLHIFDTHGYPITNFCGWVFDSIYGVPMKEFSTSAHLFNGYEEAYDKAKKSLTQKANR